MWILKWLFLAFVAVVAGLFAVANSHIVAIDLAPIPFTIDVPLFLLVLLSVILGVVLCWLMSFGQNIRLRFELSQKQRCIKALENELATIKLDQRIDSAS